MLQRITDLYIDGFRNMKLGNKLWFLIAIKLLILFGVIKLFFFPDVLHTQFDNDVHRSAYVLEHLTQRK